MLQQSTLAVFQGVTFGQCRSNLGPFTTESPVRGGSSAPVRADPTPGLRMSGPGRGAPSNSVTPGAIREHRGGVKAADRR